MSLSATTLVWERSKATGSALLVLLSLAERANRDHAGVCWSRIETVAKRTRLGHRQAQRSIAELVELRELYVQVAHGRGRTNAYMVTCGRTRAFIVQALVDILGLSRHDAEQVAEQVSDPVGKGVTDIGFSTAEKVTPVTRGGIGKGVTGDTLSDPENTSSATPLEDGKRCHIRQEKVTNPVRKGVTDDVPPRPPIRKNQHEPLENHDRRRRAPSPACAPARIDDDDFLETILGEFERQTGRQRKPADEVAARTLRDVAFESVRRGIAKSVAAVGDGRVSSLRYCVPAIEEFERARAQANVGAAPRPVAVPDPDPEVDGADGFSDSEKKPVWAEVEKFLTRTASMYGRVPDHGEIRARLILECGFDPGLIEAMYPTGNGSSASSPSQVFTTASAVKE